MGYHRSQINGELTIRPEREVEALAAINHDPEIDLEFGSFDEAMAEVGFDVERDEAGQVIGLAAESTHVSYGVSDDEYPYFAAIAPFVEPGGELVFEDDEEGFHVMRYRFDGEQCHEEWADIRIVWPGEEAA